MWRVRLAFLFLCFVEGVAVASAEIACNDVSAIPGPIGYHRRENTERCEGFYQQQDAGSLEFVSLVNGRINYDLVTDKILIVSVPSLPQFQGSQVFLAARALPAGTHYRMDAVIAPSGKFNWSLNEVLAPARLSSNSIGVVAWINQTLGKYYVPVSVVPANVAPSATQPPQMILQSSMDIDLLRWRVRREGAGASTDDYVRVGGEHPAIIRAGQPISIDLRNQPSGPVIVDVAANYPNMGRPDSKQFRVILP